MAHFYEIIKDQRIDFGYEINKLLSLVNEEKHYYCPTSSTLFAYLNEKVFRKIRLSDNFTDIGSYVSKIYKVSKDDRELFIYFCEFLMSLLFQCHYYLEPNVSDALKEQTDEIYKIINSDLRKLNLTTKDIDDEELGKLFLIIPKNETLEKALKIVDESNIQDHLIEYSSSHCDGNIKRKEELLILMQKYIEGITKNNQYKDLNKRLFENVDLLFNNLDLRHNQKVKDIRFYELTNGNREHWLDMLYDLSLLVINSKSEYENNKEIMEVKRKAFGEK